MRLRGGGESDGSDWNQEIDDWGGEIDDDFAGSESNGEDGNEDSDYEDTTPETQLLREKKEAEDVTAKNIDEKKKFIPNSRSAIIPQSELWMRLHGFQGYVPFIPGDRKTYETAIRRLLSLGPQDHKPFSLVHFDVQSDTVKTIHDSLPLNPDSMTLQYIVEMKLKEERSPVDQHSFFVHLEHESTPKHWKPSDDQFDTSVSCVGCPLDGVEGKSKGVVASVCYLTFPKFNDSQPSLQDVYGWGADQLNAYINTAFEVLLGRPKDSFHHANFQLDRPNLDFTKAPPVYGLYTAASSDILSLIPNGDGKHFRLKCSPLGNNNVAIVLPGCFEISNPTSELGGEITMSKVLEFMRNIISSAFGDYAKRLKYVRLLDGRATLGPEISRDQEYYSIRMSDDIPQNSEIDYSSALSKIAATPNPFVLLYPEWEEDENVLHLSASDGEDVAEHSVHMPSLSSTVDEFMTSVFELMQLAKYEPSRIEDVKRGDAFISVQPEMENESAGINFDMPCFFIGPNTTDEEWFGIRARIPTPSAKIKILDSKAWNWRDQVDKTNIWGPRYGLMAGVQATINKPESEDTTEQEKEETSQDRAEETAQEAAQTPVLDSSVGVEALRAVLRETEPFKATHAEPTKTQRLGRDATGDSDVRQKSWTQQPSSYDNYGSHSWPNGSGTNAESRIPKESRNFMTFTEQVRLKRDYLRMRNILLKRTTPLHDGSRVSDQQTTKPHSESFHMVRRCMFCDDVIPEDWKTEQVYRHLRGKHRNELMEALGATKAIVWQDGKRVISIPLEWGKRPHNPSPVALANDDMIVDKPETQQHHHKKASEFCDRCGSELDTSHPAQDGRDQHCKNCKGSNEEAGRFCLYCGKKFSRNATQTDWDENAAHMTECHEKIEGDKSHLLPPEVAAYNQQQHNLRRQVNEVVPGTIDSDEAEEITNIEDILNAINSEAEQDANEMDLDESDEEPRRPEPTTKWYRTLEEAINRAISGQKILPIDSPDADGYQEAHPDAISRGIDNISVDEPNAPSPSMTQSRAPSEPVSPDSLAAESEKEHEVSQPETREMAETPELEPPESSESEPDNASDFENEPDQDESGDEESEDDTQGNPLSSKRRKRGGKKRGKKGDRNYTFSDDEDDDEDSEIDEDGKRTKPPRRAPSPNWQRTLGPDDPNFEPTDDYYCSKCFRKAPKKHKRDRSPLGRTREIEVRYNSHILTIRVLITDHITYSFITIVVAAAGSVAAKDQP